jgi:hypothetical protein
MAADQRHYLSPLPEPQETERRTTLEIVAEKLRSEPIVRDIAKNLEELAERELRVTGSWSLVPDSQAAWVTTAVQYLESCGLKLPEAERPDPYWADDVAGGIVVSVKAILGTDDLHVRIESQYSGGKRTQPGRRRISPSAKRKEQSRWKERQERSLPSSALCTLRLLFPLLLALCSLLFFPWEL